MSIEKPDNQMNNPMAFLAMAQNFSEFMGTAHDRIVKNELAGGNDPQIHDYLNKIPHLCQELLDTSYTGGINAMYSTFQKLDNGTARTFVGDFLIRNLDEMDTLDSDRAKEIGYSVGLELAKIPNDILFSITAINIKETVEYRDQQGWFPDELTTLKKNLITPGKWDLPRQKFLKTHLFKDIKRPEKTKPQKGDSSEPHTSYYDLSLFVFDNEIDMNSLRFLPLATLFRHAVDKVYYDENGAPRPTVSEEDFILIGKTLQAMYDIDNNSTCDYLLQSLDSYDEADYNNVAAQIMADFLQQKLTIQLNQNNLEQDFYDFGHEVCQRYLAQSNEPYQQNIALINLRGMIENFRENNMVKQFILEKDVYLTPYEQDSAAQKQAKTFIANNYKVTIDKKPLQP